MLNFKRPNAGKNVARQRTKLWVEDGRVERQYVVTIETLPDEVFLTLFNFYVVYSPIHEAWITLTHVCRRWRNIVFASPLRLNLRLYCKASKPVREMLDIWPPLPIVVHSTAGLEEGMDNIIAALEHNDRVCGINIYIDKVSRSVFGRFAIAMQKPFPELTYLTLRSADELTLALPETLGGSAPHLRSCKVDYLPLPVLRKLLMSARHLVDLRLWNIPHSAYISSHAMVACLSSAPSLQTLALRFRSPRHLPDRASQHPHPLTHAVLPALTDFIFHGVSEYLEDFISRVDAPLLDMFDIILFHQVTFDVSQLHQFIGRTEKLSTLNIANVGFDGGFTSLELSQETSAFSRPRIRLSTRCNGSDWQLSFLAQACSSLSPTLSTFETLNVRENGFKPLTLGWEEDMENSQWLELFHPFTSVKNLYLSKKLVPVVMHALQQLAEERVIDVLPMLQKLYLERLRPSEPVQEGTSQFVAAQQLFNHSITVEPWDGPE